MIVIKPIRATLNVDTARKCSDGLIAARIDVADISGAIAYYACRVERISDFTAKLERDSIKCFDNGKWQTVTVDDDTADMLFDCISALATDYYHLFVKDGKDGKKSMWADTVVIAADGGRYKSHRIKIGNCVFDTHDGFTLTRHGAQSIAYKVIGDTGFSSHILRLDKPSALLDRLQKQMSYAKQRYTRMSAAKPIGFKSWGEQHDYRYSTGQYATTARQYERNKNLLRSN